MLQCFAKYFCKILQRVIVKELRYRGVNLFSSYLKSCHSVSKRKKASFIRMLLLFLIIVAATYFTRFEPSIIGGSGLNFSVRDGKR